MRIDRWFWGSSRASGEVIDETAREIANNAQTTANRALEKVNSIVTSSLDYVTIPIAVNVNNALGTTGRWYLTNSGNINAAFDEEHFLDSYTTDTKKAGYQTSQREVDGALKYREYTSDVVINPATDSFTIAIEIGGSQVSSSSVTVAAYTNENMTAELGNHQYFDGHVYAAGNKLLSGRVSFNDPSRPVITNAVMTINGYNIVTITNGTVNISPTTITLGHSEVKATSGSYDDSTGTINVEYSIEWTDYTGSDFVGEWLSISPGQPKFYLACTYSIPDAGTSRNFVLISSSGLNVVHVDWGDGVTEDREVGSSQLAHTYTQPGTYTAVFTSNDNILSISTPTAGREVITRLEKYISSTVTSANSSFINALNLTYVGEFSLPNANFFNTTFSGCSGITSNLPRIWETNPDASHTGTFTGCVNALNYAEIPDDWK